MKAMKNIQWLLLFAVAILALGLMPSRAGAAGLWPLAVFSEDETMVLPPFYMHEGDFMMVFPFYYRTNQGKDHHFVWPLVKVSEGRLTRVAPVWFRADADTFTIFPFLRQTPDYTFWSVPPVYTRHDGNFTALWPLYAKSPETLFVAPSFYQYHHAGSNGWMIVPLYFTEKTAKSREDVVPGLFYNWQSENARMLWIIPSYYSRKGETTKWNLFPLYFSKWSPEQSEYEIPILFDYLKYDSGYDFWLVPFKKSDNGGKKTIGIVPVWWHTREIIGKDGEQTLLWLFPLLREKSPRFSSTIILPLFRNDWKKMETGEEKNFWLLPWVQGTAPGESYHGLLPLYYYEREKQKENLHQDLSLLWPLYRSEITKSPDGKTLDYYNRFLIFSESKSQDGTRVFRLLGIPIVERTK